MIVVVSAHAQKNQTSHGDVSGGATRQNCCCVLVASRSGIPRRKTGDHRWYISGHLWRKYWIISYYLHRYSACWHRCSFSNKWYIEFGENVEKGFFDWHDFPGFRSLRICADLQDFCRYVQICSIFADLCRYVQIRKKLTYSEIQ